MLKSGVLISVRNVWGVYNPSAYQVMDNKGYTNVTEVESKENPLALPRCSNVTEGKHYYAGAERIAARKGGGRLQNVVESNPSLQSSATAAFYQSFQQVNTRVLEANANSCLLETVHNTLPNFRYSIKNNPRRMKALVTISCDSIMKIIRHLQETQQNDDGYVYYYHSDHLGSASWITNHSGNAVQHLQYLPFGEPFVDQHPAGYQERYRFTGKERDEETGYGYFGARYMDHELMTMWLSVDPLADKYPSISPYAYCAWNPVKLVDPDGREIDDYYNLKGELIRHTNEGNNLYLVITEGTEVIEDRTIVVPTNASLGKIKSIYSYNNQLNEKGIAVESDGSCAGMATGSKTHISKAQWKPVFDDINKRGAKVDFLVHLHPADFAHLDIGDRNPSDLDRQHSNFYNSKLGAILSFVQPFDFNRTGQSTNSRDYIKYISFYNETSEKYIHTMKFDEFERLIKDINEKSGRQ